LVTYVDLQCGDALAIVAVPELIFGFDKCSFGLRNPSGNPDAKLVDGFVSGACAIQLEPHPRELASVCHE
jgi:hypothetical protein